MDKNRIFRAKVENLWVKRVFNQTDIYYTIQLKTTANKTVENRIGIKTVILSIDCCFIVLKAGHVTKNTQSGHSIQT